MHGLVIKISDSTFSFSSHTFILLYLSIILILTRFNPIGPRCPICPSNQTHEASQHLFFTNCSLCATITTRIDQFDRWLRSEDITVIMFLNGVLSLDLKDAGTCQSLEVITEPILLMLLKGF